MTKPDYKQQDDKRGKKAADYWPLFSLLLVSVLVACALTQETQAMQAWMHYFMGFFLCVFALLKLFHPAAFADGFQMYDLIGKRSRIYAYMYPLIELALGLSYLSFWQPRITYVATITVMIIGSIGVVSALRRGLDINCPCMGSVLDVPLSTVTLVEDIGMAAMAVTLLCMTI